LAGTANLFGVTTRAQNPAFLSVQTIDCTPSGLNIGSIRQSINVGCAQLASVSGAPNACYLHPTTWFRLASEIGTQDFRNGPSGEGAKEATFGYSSLTLETPFGPVEVISDPQAMCYLNPSTYAIATYSGANIGWLLEEDTMTFVSLGEMGKLDAIGSDSTSYFLRNGTGAYTYQMSGFGQLGFMAPGHSAILLLPLGA
jgi:hypothetical protein